MTAPLSTSDDHPSSEMPAVRLLPKANARAIRHGFPWVYANEMVLDRRTKKLAPGTLARLEDSARQVMGVVAVNPLSKIAARMIDQNADAVIDQAWFEGHIARALALRSQLYDAPFTQVHDMGIDGVFNQAQADVIEQFIKQFDVELGDKATSVEKEIRI